MSSHRRTLLIVGLAIPAAGILAMFVLVQLGIVRLTSASAAMGIGGAAALVLISGVVLLVVFIGDGMHLKRLLWEREGRCPGCGLKPTEIGSSGMCASCGASMSYPPLDYPVRGPCGKCGYPITDVRGDRCPECGTPLHPLHIANQRRK